MDVGVLPLGRGRGLGGGLGGVGSISTIRGRTVLRGVGDGNTGVGARRVEVGGLRITAHVLTVYWRGDSGGSEACDENS